MDILDDSDRVTELEITTEDVFSKCESKATVTIGHSTGFTPREQVSFAVNIGGFAVTVMMLASDAQNIANALHEHSQSALECGTGEWPAYMTSSAPLPRYEE